MKALTIWQPWAARMDAHFPKAATGTPKCSLCIQAAYVTLTWTASGGRQGGTFCQRHASQVWRSLAQPFRDTAICEAID